MSAAQAAADLAARSAQAALNASGSQADQNAARDAYLLSARVHSLTGWYSRALGAWNSYLGLGGALDDADDAQMFVDVSFQLAFSRYQVGDFKAANAHYQALVDLLPGQTEALRWLGRIAFETGRSGAGRGVLP